mmetsp:Transcript_87114/g.177550  ORF Transcript_87114/g.177550 Transcript_87114/m.177550 type:complete len:561 (-) Transcript_87114:1191-2873(-)
MEEPPPSDCPSSSGDGGPASAVPEANELLVAHHRRASSIVFGSCNSQHYDQPFWDVIRERNPTAFVWAGDAVYADDRMQSRQQRKRQPKPEPEGAEEQGPPKPQTPGTETPTTTTTTSKHKHATPEYLRLLYEEQKKVEGYRKLLLDDNHGAGERISVFGTIDDHDYGIDNGDETFEFRRENGMEFTRFLGLDDESSAVSRRAAKGRGVYGVQVYDFAPNRARRLLSDSEAGLDPDVVSEEAFREDERGDRRGSTATTDDDDDDDDNPTDAAALLAKLSKEEDALREKMVEAKASQLPRSYDRVYWYNNTSDNWKDYPEAEKAGLETGSEELRSRWKDFDREALFRGPSLCHTARTPSRIRFDGILTNQPELKGEQVVFGKETYFTGVEDKEFLKSNRDKREANEHVPHHPMQLVYTMHDERETNCGDELAHADYHDFFMAEESEGWTSLTFPNDAEQKAYGYHQNKNKYKGMLVIVRRFCGMGVCEKGFAGIDDYRAGKWEMRVNGVPVTSMAFIGHEAIVLEHSGGIYFEPNGEGRYDLEFKINEPEHFVKISAFVLF